MAPVDSPRDNTLPVLRFAGHALLVVALSTHCLFTACRAATRLPPSAHTRSQHSRRRRSAFAFSILAFLSFVSVTTFTVRWHATSYVQWANLHNHKPPGSLWAGWFGTANGAVGHWRLGDWIADVDLAREAETVSILRPEAFLFTSQRLVGLLVTSVFIGVESHRRNLPVTVVFSFVLLGATASLGYALSLFFVTIIYTPLTHHHVESLEHDNLLLTPRPSVYYYPVAVFFLILNYLPYMLKDTGDIHLVRPVYQLIPFFFAFAPKFAPLSLRVQHDLKENAHLSYAAVYRYLSIASVILYTRLIISNIYLNTPEEPSYIRDLFSNTLSFPFNPKTIRLFSAITATGQKIKLVGMHPVISATSLDVMFTAISLLAWVFARHLDVDAMLDNSILYFLGPTHEGHVIEPLLEILYFFVPNNVFNDSVEQEAPTSTSPSPVATATRTSRRRRRRRRCSRRHELEREPERESESQISESQISEPQISEPQISEPQISKSPAPAPVETTTPRRRGRSSRRREAIPEQDSESPIPVPTEATTSKRPGRPSEKDATPLASDSISKSAVGRSTRKKSEMRSTSPEPELTPKSASKRRTKSKSKTRSTSSELEHAPKKRTARGKSKVCSTSKSSAAGSTSTSAPAPALRRSTREKSKRSALNRDIDSDADSDAEYEHTYGTQRHVAATDMDVTTIPGEYAPAGESMALALFLMFTGGLGALSAAALGAETTG